MSKGKLTIKQKGFSTLVDTKSVELSIDGNKNALDKCQEIDISMRLDEVTKATIRMLDIELDLTDIAYEVNMDELYARRLLQRICVALQDENAYITGKDQIIKEIEEMTKGMD